MPARKTRKTENSPDEPDKLEAPPFSDQPGRSIPLLLLSVTGLIISLVSGFQEHIPLLKFLCSSACRNTADFHFLGLPFWLWGAFFYSGATVPALFRQELTAWIAGPAAGVEAVLILLMIQLKVPCVFCIANAAVVLALLAATFRKRLLWQEATLALVFFVGFFFWVPFENHLSLSATTSAARSGEEAGIAATVGDQVITKQRLDVVLGPRLQETRRDIYRMERERLDQLIVETILEKEAKQQGKTPGELVDQIAPASSFQVEEPEIDKYMQDNQARLQEFQGSIPELRAADKSISETAEKIAGHQELRSCPRTQIRRAGSFAGAESAHGKR